MRILRLALVALLASPAAADAPDIRAIVEGRILPGYETLALEAADLSKAAQDNCTPGNEELTTAYHDAFDAWVSVSHLRFGPSEQNDRAFALAFWPDPRGSTPKALATMIRDEDTAVDDAETFETVSIAARGFYALEFLLFDPQFASGEAGGYSCRLVQAVTTDIAMTSEAILAGWRDGYADLMTDADNDTYRTSTEAAQQVFTALSTGLEFTSQTRLGRPLGTFDRPRPNRAEARRSERSLRHVILSLAATRDLASLLSNGDSSIDAAFEMAIERAEALDDPVLAGVADPQSRFQVEVLKQNIETIRRMLIEDLGPSLGITAGFNSLDGD